MIKRKLVEARRNRIISRLEENEGFYNPALGFILPPTMHRAGEEAGRWSTQVKNKESFLNYMANGMPESGGQSLTLSHEETSRKHLSASWTHVFLIHQWEEHCLSWVYIDDQRVDIPTGRLFIMSGFLKMSQGYVWQDVDKWMITWLRQTVSIQGRHRLSVLCISMLVWSVSPSVTQWIRTS